MTDILTPDMLLQELGGIIILLMVINIVLTGVVILLSFRVTQYKKLAEETEEKLNKSVREAFQHED